MDILRIVITVLFVIDCIVLTVLVLMQEGKQQGLGSIEGGLKKATVVTGFLFFILAGILNLNF